ncbi:ankyrin repeat domain-containing protein [Candidatus Chromulinivorax destructor]|uniref:Uncharacterized protein n=1 Tax=Candidatus Chromulinivorax destructor TaxID=2066483 RepID=A0A345ZC45_9BACT|nr:ankyrin repeat domain-containing protein [Candidatus Chromulinivorax destructor]AXK60862.1 hypothetical protein C0J27_03905 [Candidatus Chromulinivorax destructor]
MNNSQKIVVGFGLIMVLVAGVYLQFGKKAEILDEQGRTSLYQIIQTNDIQAVQDCILSGSNVNHVDANGMTPLQFTTQLRIHKNSGEIAQLLIDAGADTTLKNEADWTLLQMAVNKRNEFVAGALIKAGLDVNVQDPVDGCTPLHTAVIQACTAAIKDYQGLISCPCCVEKMFTKSLAIAQSVLNAGADTTIKNKNGHTAQDIIEVMFATVTLGQDDTLVQPTVYYDVQALVDKPEDFDTKVALKFQALRDIFIA